MPVMEQPDLSRLAEHLPLLTQVLAGAGCLGAVLLLFFGRKLVRTGHVLTGIVVGAALGFLLSGGFRESGWWIPWTILGAIGGLTVSLLLFRLWVGLSLSLVLGIALPLTVLLWQQTPGPEQVEAVDAQTYEAWRDTATTAIDPLRRAELNPEEIEGLKREITERISALPSAQYEAVREWWDDLPPDARRLSLAMCLTGAILGLVVGLIRPHFGAAMQSALIGAVLLLTCGQYLLASFAVEMGEYRLGPRGFVAAAGLITVVGIGVQWTIFRGKADKGRG